MKLSLTIISTLTAIAEATSLQRVLVDPGSPLLIDDVTSLYYDNEYPGMVYEGPYAPDIQHHYQPVEMSDDYLYSP